MPYVRIQINANKNEDINCRLQTALPKSIFFAALLMISFAACRKEDVTLKENNYRRVAWNYLSTDSKAIIIVDWKAASITYQSYNNQNVAAVRLNTTQDAVLGPIVVFLSVETTEVLAESGRN